MTDQWSVQCRLWTAAHLENLPLSYAFLADLGGAVGEIVLAESSPLQSLTGFILPSSRTLLWGADLGGRGSWHLCRINCPLTVTAVISNSAGASRRVSVVSNITRPGCTSPFAPCNPAPMTELIDAALNSVDIGGPDPEKTNYQLLTISLELSDIKSFSLNSSDPAATRPPSNANPILSSRRSAKQENIIPERALLSEISGASNGAGTAPIRLTEEETSLLLAALGDDLLQAVPEAADLLLLRANSAVKRSQLEGIPDDQESQLIL
jgi:hypothetical protein